MELSICPALKTLVSDAFPWWEDKNCPAYSSNVWLIVVLHNTTQFLIKLSIFVINWRIWHLSTLKETSHSFDQAEILHKYCWNLYLSWSEVTVINLCVYGWISIRHLQPNSWEVSAWRVHRVQHFKVAAQSNEPSAHICLTRGNHLLFG